MITGYSPAVRRHYRREPKGPRARAKPQIILESVQFGDGRRGYYHCHILVDGVRTDIMATYNYDHGLVHLEPANRRDRLPYYVSELTERRQKRLDKRIKFQLADRDKSDLREPHPDYSFPLLIPISKDLEVEYRKKRSKSKKDSSRDVDIPRQRDIVQRTIERHATTILQKIGFAKEAEQRSSQYRKVLGHIITDENKVNQ